MKKHPSKVTPRLYKALRLAYQLHGRDARKSSQVPVLVHLLGVCGLVQYDGGGEDEAVAALLHDALEDKAGQLTRTKLVHKFGDRVLAIIEVSTDTPMDYRGGAKPPWKIRKDAYLDRVRQTSPDLLRVTIADKIDNIRSMLADHRTVGEKLWERFTAGKSEIKWFHQSALEAYQDAGASGPLLEELRQLVGQLDRL